MNFPKRRRRRCPVLKAVQWLSGEHGFTPVSEPSGPPVHAGGFFGDIATKEVCEGSWLAGWPLQERSMCDYSYMRSQLVPQRSRKRWCRPNSNLRRPGALRARAIRRLRSAFVQEPSSHSRMTFKPAVSCFGRKSAIGWARFRQIAFDQPSRHHDALEFSNGAVVLVTDLSVGQRATVLQLPASPMDEKIETPQPTARYEAADI
jgi:hypothetical protein